MLALRKTGPKEELKELVQKLTELRKEEQTETGRTTIWNARRTNPGMIGDAPETPLSI